MPVRSGGAYVESLREHAPTVFLAGRRVADVTAEPVLQPALRSVAELYDMQLDPAHRELMTWQSPTTGEPVSTSFLIPYTREALARKRQHFKLRADHSFGFLGRAPDFMNQFVTVLHLVADRFAAAGDRFGDNATRYYEHVRERDLFLTHMLINPQIDRSRTSAQQADPFLHLGRAGQTADGIIVRGAKMLGTMAPITEEVVVMPFGGVPPGDDAYAVAFAIPSGTPGLSFICRETVAPGPRSSFDHPLSSRFEEMDCIAVFDDVLVPWDRVFVDGGPGSAAIFNGLGAEFSALLSLQMTARTLSQLEFFCGLAVRLADAIGITGFLHVQEKLGEMLGQMEIARAVFYGAEAMARELGGGVWVPGGAGMRALQIQSGTIYRRFVEIVQLLGAGGFFYAPTGADLASPELRPVLDRYLQGRPGVSAAERVALFKLAWDATGETFAQRMAQYVRFYGGDPVRLAAGFYEQYDKAPLSAIVDRALAGPGAPLGAPSDGAVGAVPYRPDNQSMAGAYAASSLPPRREEGR